MRDLPERYQAGVSFEVTIAVTPFSPTTNWAVEEKAPPGWTVSDISDSGVWDSSTGKVKWGPFISDEGKTLSCTVTPPSSATGYKLFTGEGGFDGAVGEISGDEVTAAEDVEPPVVTDVAAVPSMLRENVDANMTLTAVASDAATGDSAIERGEYFVGTDPGAGMGAFMAPADGLFDTPVEAMAANVPKRSV